MFLLGRSAGRDYIIRLSITLNEQIERHILNKALLATTKKCPFFFVHFMQHNNRIISQPVEHIPEVKVKTDIADMKLSKECEAQVSYSQGTIFLEYFHAISDGKGGMEFLIHLVAEYLALKYYNNIFLNGTAFPPLCEQRKNGYKDFARKLKTEKSQGKAYKLNGTVETLTSQHITTYMLSIDEVKAISKSYAVSVTEFLTALLCLSFGKIQAQLNKNQKQKKIRMSVPVNLRTRFPCQTMRNFTLNVYPEYNPSTDKRDLTSLCMKIHSYMQKASDFEKLAGRCSSATIAAAVLSALPISFNKCLVRFVLNNSVAGSTMTLSNMGTIDLPFPLKEYIVDVDMLFSTKPGSPYSCSVISIGGLMKISFLRVIKESFVETEFERILQYASLSVTKQTESEMVNTDG